MFKKLLLISAILIFSVKDLIAKDIPIIVIAPSKKPQSVSTVGSSVVVLDEEFLKDPMNILGDVLSSGMTSTNFFQNGGHGSTSAIQLRGLPKKIFNRIY